jgi:hypothetical protein
VVHLVIVPLKSPTGNAGRLTNVIFLFARLIVKLALGVIGVLAIRAATILKPIASHVPDLRTEFETSLFSPKMEANCVQTSEKLKLVMKPLVQFLASFLLGVLGVNAMHDVVVDKNFELVTLS